MRATFGLSRILLLLAGFGIASEQDRADAQEAPKAPEEYRPITFHVAGFT